MKKINRGFVSIVSLFSLCACANQKPLSTSIYAFDTVVDIHLYDGSEEDISNIKTTCLEIDNLANSYKEVNNVNNVYTINHTNEAVKVDAKLFSLLKQSYSYIGLTNGYFNPLVGELSDAWKESLSKNIVLSDSQIESYVEDINNTSLYFDEVNLTVQRNGKAKIDLGAIAKGYFLSLVKDSISINEYLLNAGSSSLLLGQNREKSTFNVGLRYLANAYLKLNNTSVGTSSIYEQFTEIDNISYSHLINPKTGSAVSLYDFVVVVASDPIFSDVLSTSFMHMELKDIKSFVDGYDDIKVIVSQNKQIIYKSESLEVYYH